MRLRSILPQQDGLQCQEARASVSAAMSQLGDEESAPAIYQLSDATDRSHHWIRAFCRQIIPSLKCFGRVRVGCGAETALGCVGGRLLPRPWPRRPKQGGISGGRSSRRTFGRDFIGPACRGRLEDFARATTGWRRSHDYGGFVETAPKRYTFGTGTARNWLDLV